jgi:hypothetical protein
MTNAMCQLPESHPTWGVHGRTQEVGWGPRADTAEVDYRSSQGVPRRAPV